MFLSQDGKLITSKHGRRFEFARWANRVPTQEFRLRVVTCGEQGGGAAVHCYEAEAGTEELAQMILIIAIRRTLWHSFTQL